MTDITLAGDAGPSVKRVLFTLRMLPVDESLMGMVRRSAFENEMSSAAPILEEVLGSRSAFKNLASRPDLDPARLGACIRVPVEQIENRLHRVTRTVAKSDFTNFFGAVIPSCHLELSRRRISPGALSIRHYHRALWHHVLLPFDRETGEMLIEKCPACERSLEWGGGGPLDLCNMCGFVLTSSATTVVPVTDLRLMAPLTGLLDPDPERRRMDCRDLHPDLLAHDRGAVFELGWRLGRAALAERKAGSGRATLLSVHEIVRTLRAGARMLAGWPAAPRDFAVDRLREGGSAASVFTWSVRSIATAADARTENEALIRKALPEMLLPISDFAKKSLAGGVSTQMAERILGIDSRTFLRCLRTGGVEPLSRRGVSKLHKTFDAAKLTEARALLDDAMSYSNVTEALGISLAAVECLVANGALREITHPLVVGLRASRIVSRSSYELFVTKLRGLASGSVETPTRLRTMLNRIGGRQKPWGALFGRMLAGELPFAIRQRTSKSQRLVDLIDLPGSAATSIAALIDGPDLIATERSATMPRRDAEWLLNANAQCIGSALSAELAHAVHDDGSLVVEHVLELARARIGGAEIAARFMAGSRKLPDALRSGGLPRLGVSGWDRAAAETLLSGDRVAAASAGCPTVDR